MQYFDYLDNHGVSVDFCPLIDSDALRSRYAKGKYTKMHLIRAYGRRIADVLNAGSVDVLWVEKELMAWVPGVLEGLLLRRVPYVIDYDDAVFHTYDLDPRPMVRGLLGPKIAQLMRRAAAVVVGNPYLADYARQAGAQHIRVVPSVVDLALDPPLSPFPKGRFTVGWVGSPSSGIILESLRPMLATLLEDPEIELHLVGATEDTLAGLRRVILPWSEATQQGHIDRFHVGIMPLEDTPWQRGKCGYKLIQYMGRARPVVASPVGVNREIVQNGKTGYLATSSEEWAEAIAALRLDSERAAAMGEAGYERVQARYSLEGNAPLVADVLRSASQRSSHRR